MLSLIKQLLTVCKMKEEVIAAVEKYGITAVAEAAMVTERTVKLAMTIEKRVISAVRWNRAMIKLGAK